MPTRTGYSFVGWRGRNLFSIYGTWDLGNATYSIENNSISVTGTGSSDGQSYVKKRVTLSEGFYALSIGSYKTTGDVDYKSVGIVNLTEGLLYGSFVVNSVVGETIRQTTFEIESDDWELCLTIFVHDFAILGTGTVTVSDIMLEEINEGGSASKYEPHFIQRDTIFSNPGDRTLTAEWTANSNNIFTNGDFEDVYTQTDTGWDNSLNGTLHATGWEDYNGEITSPSTAVHAHIKDISSTDPQHGHVFEMIGAHREYIAALQLFESTTKITTGTYRISASVKGVSGQNMFYNGLYYAKTGTGYENSNFYSGCMPDIRFGETDWFRISWEFSITQISYAHGFYLYGQPESWSGISPSMNNIFYLDDVFLEKIA